MASKLKQLQSKACQASQFLSKHGTTYYKQMLEQNKQYIQEPATVEKCNELSKQLLYTRLARLTFLTFWCFLLVLFLLYVSKCAKLPNYPPKPSLNFQFLFNSCIFLFHFFTKGVLSFSDVLTLDDVVMTYCLVADMDL